MTKKVKAKVNLKLERELEKVKELEAAMGGMQLNGIAQFLIENPIQTK
jgi:hypothetical protein